MKGDLLLWRASEGKAGPVSGETRIAAKDRLGAKDGNQTVLITEAGTIVALKGVRAAEERGLGIERRENKLIFKVFEGKLAVQTFEEGVKIETPQGQIAASNAYFTIEVEKDKTVKLTSHNGEPAFTNSLGSVVVEPGRETVVEPGKKPSVPKIVEAGKATEEFTRTEAAFNLLKNPGFEDGLKDWDATFFTAASGKRQTELETALSHSGKACARFDVSNKLQGPKPDFHRFAAQGIPTEAGKTYLFRVFVRSDIREGQVIPRIMIYNSDLADPWKFPADKSWRMLTGRVTAKEKSMNVNVEANIQSDRYEGSFWVDDFFLTEIPGSAKSK